MTRFGGRAGRLCSTWASFRKSTPMPRMGHFEALPDQLAIGARQPRGPHQPRDRNALDGGQDGLELRWTRDPFSRGLPPTRILTRDRLCSITVSSNLRVAAGQLDFRPVKEC